MRARIAPVSLVLLLALACAGSRAREHALWPTIASTWPAVHEAVVVGLDGATPSPAAMAAIAQVEAAVQADDYRLLQDTDWPAVEPLARLGVQVRVDRGEVSEGVSVSLLERIDRFTEAMQELTKQ